MSYGEFWDNYVKKHRVEKLGGQYPGDVWGSPENWKENVEKCFLPYIPKNAKRFVEIGSGSGKYTDLILNSFPESNIIACDVSIDFLNVLGDRLSDYIVAGRVSTLHLNDDPYCLRSHLKTVGAYRQIDCLCSLDAMVHVDLQYLMAYLLTASEALKIGGALVMSFADATSDAGFAKLIRDIPTYYHIQGRTTGKFEFISPEIVKSILGRLGFGEIHFLDENRRDMWVTAIKTETVNINW